MQIFKKYIQFYIFKVHNFVLLMYTIFKRVFIILYIECTQFFKESKQFFIFNLYNFSNN